MIIVLAADDNYAKYVAVTIASVIHCHHKDGAVQFYILNKDFTPEHREMLESMSDDRHTITCVDVKGRLDSQLLYISGHVTEETYYRILIPDLFPDVDQALYIDCDIVCQGDIEDLWQAIPMSDGDWVAGSLAANLDAKNDYTTSHLGIPSDSYVNAGVLMMNLKALRDIDLMSQCIAMLKEKHWFDQHDQDLVNAICYGHIKIMDHRWHITVGALARNIGKRVEDLQAKDLTVFFLHYATHKPWREEMFSAMLPFWQYVHQTPFADEIVAAYREVSDTKGHFKALCANNQVSLAYLMQCMNEAVQCRLHRRK